MLKQREKKLEKNSIIKFIVVVGISLSISILLILFFYSYTRKSDFQKLLENNFKENTLVRLDSLIDEREGTACIIYPYASQVPNINKETEDLNSYLSKINYENSEFITTFAVISNKKIKLFKFEQWLWSNLLIANYNHAKKVQVPNGFKFQDCVSIKDAYLYQTLINGQYYIILGEKNDTK